MSPHRAFFLALAAMTGVYACTLDFSKWEGAAPGGDGGTGAEGGSEGGTTTTTTGGMGGDGGMGGSLPASCSNMMVDGTETDEDCGGDVCNPCDNSEMCLVFSDCESQFCSAGTCAPCTVDGNCADATGTWCNTAVDGGTCVPTSADGVGCVGSNECTSTFCQDAVCCDAACTGNCESCTGGDTIGGVTGACSPIKGTTDPDDDCGAMVCDGGNSCVTFCGLGPTSPGGACPAICDNNCAGGVCVIDCDGNECLNLTCPAGFPCTVNCDSNGECAGNIQCPDYYACDVICTGVGGCADAHVQCAATGTCFMSCADTSNVCLSAELNCGTNECIGSCPGAQASRKTTVACGSSCSCTECL